LSDSFCKGASSLPQGPAGKQQPLTVRAVALPHTQPAAQGSAGPWGRPELF